MPWLMTQRFPSAHWLTTCSMWNLRCRVQHGHQSRHSQFTITLLIQIVKGNKLPKKKKINIKIKMSTPTLANQVPIIMCIFILALPNSIRVNEYNHVSPRILSRIMFIKFATKSHLLPTYDLCVPWPLSC